MGETGAWKKPPGVSGLPQASWVLALLPTVVSVGTVPPTVSHGPTAAGLRKGPVGVVQPAPWTQQPMTELVGVASPRLVMAGLAVK